MVKRSISILTALVTCFTLVIPNCADAYWGNELMKEEDIGAIKAIVLNIGDFALQYFGVSTTLPDAVANTLSEDLQRSLKQTEFGSQMLQVYNATVLATNAWIELGDALSQVGGARKQLLKSAVDRGQDCISSTLNEIVMCYELGEREYKMGIVRTEDSIKTLDFLADKKQTVKDLREYADNPVFWFWNRPDSIKILGFADRLDFIIASTKDGSDLYLKGYQNAKTLDEANHESTINSGPMFNITAWPRGTLRQSDKFYCRGSITSNYSIIEASTYITNIYGSRVQEKTVYPNKSVVNILNDGLDDLKFGELSAGAYTLYFTANDSSGANNIWSSSFNISEETVPPSQQERSTLEINMTVAPSGVLKQGEKFYCRGNITSNYVIISATTKIQMSSGESAQTLTVYPNKTYVDILNDGLDKLKFAQLSSGSYTILYSAQDSSGMTVEKSFSFEVSAPSDAIKIYVSSEPQGTLPKGQPFFFRGTISSGCAITQATVSIFDINRNVVQSKTVYPNKEEVDILADGLDDLKFGVLPSGSYTMSLNAYDSSGATTSWSSQTFTIE